MSISAELIKNGYACIPCKVEVLLDLIELSARLHNLPIEEKVKIAADVSSGVLGYYPADNDVGFSEFPQFSGLRRRGYASFDYTCYEGCLGVSKVFGGNKMPVGNTHYFNDIRRDIMSAYNTLRKISIDVVMALHCELDRDLPLHKLAFDEKDPPYALLRLLSYKKTEDISKAHTDYEYITLIITSQEGLEVQDESGRWIRLKNSGPECIVIAGDMIELFSNGKIKSTIHRVGPRFAERYSVVFFLGIHFNEEIKSLHLLEDGPVTFGEHVIGMSARSAPHLSGILGEIESDHGFRIPTKNPLRRAIK
jgi:isopenicillin N synthase-like dioxygenase